MLAATTPVRVGLLLPSTNVTLETELPVLLARHQTARFTIHSSRLRLHAGAQEPLPELPTVLPDAGRLLKQDRREAR